MFQQNRAVNKSISLKKRKLVNIMKKVTRKDNRNLR